MFSIWSTILLVVIVHIRCRSFHGSLNRVLHRADCFFIWRTRPSFCFANSCLIATALKRAISKQNVWFSITRVRWHPSFGEWRGSTPQDRQFQRAAQVYSAEIWATMLSQLFAKHICSRHIWPIWFMIMHVFPPSIAPCNICSRASHSHTSSA